MANYKTGAQRYNDRMDKLWDSAIAMKQKYCKHHFVNEKVLFTNKKIKVCEYCGVRK